MSRFFSSRLARHLSVALLVKALALAALWHAFVAPQKKHVDTHDMAARVAGPKKVSFTKEAFTDDRFDRH